MSVLRATLKQMLAPSSKAGPTVISTFSGAGGSSLGLSWAGCQVLWASQFISEAAAVGRILPGPDAEGAPQYLNSPDSPIYHKSKILYGLAEARAAVSRADSAIITQGYLDFISLFQAGIEHTVAACGTTFGPAQAALLLRYTHRAYILGDSDSAGRTAAVRAAGPAP